MSQSNSSRKFRISPWRPRFEDCEQCLCKPAIVLWVPFLKEHFVRDGVSRAEGKVRFFARRIV